MQRTSRGVPDESRDVAPGPDERSVRTGDGRVLQVPLGWVLVPPGDPGLTRRVKAAGPTWAVKEKRGRRMFSRGVWADAAIVEAIVEALQAERADPSYARKLDAGRRRRDAAQAVYASDFEAAVRDFLGFHSSHAVLHRAVASAIAEHAVQVGSGTVARTQRIPIEQRAQAATIAWLRHQTTEYDDLKIPRVKGMRREVRRMLAERSRQLLDRYRRGDTIEPASCLLRRALDPFTD